MRCRTCRRTESPGQERRKSLDPVIDRQGAQVCVGGLNDINSVDLDKRHAVIGAPGPRTVDVGLPLRVQGPSVSLAVEGVGVRHSNLVVAARSRRRRVEHHEVPRVLLESGARRWIESVGSVSDGRIAQRVQAVKRSSVGPAVEDSDPDAIRLRSIRQSGLHGRQVVPPVVAASPESNRLRVLFGWIGIGLADNRACGAGLVQVAEQHVGLGGPAEEGAERHGQGGPPRGLFRQPAFERQHSLSPESQTVRGSVGTGECLRVPKIGEVFEWRPSGRSAAANWQLSRGNRALGCQKWPPSFEQPAKVYSISRRRQSTRQRGGSVQLSSRRRWHGPRFVVPT